MQSKEQNRSQNVQIQLHVQATIMTEHEQSQQTRTPRKVQIKDASHSIEAQRPNSAVRSATQCSYIYIAYKLSLKRQVGI